MNCKNFVNYQILHMEHLANYFHISALFNLTLYQKTLAIYTKKFILKPIFHK